MNSVFNNSMYGSQLGGGSQYVDQSKGNMAWTNPLTAEDERELHKGPSALSLDIPKENMLRAKCTHRDPNTRQFTVRMADDGNGCVCTKCGAKFNVVDNVDMKQIEEVIGGAIDILQTIKLAYVDMTPEVVQTYFVILPFLELAPKLYEAAMQTLKRAVPNAALGANAVNGDYYNSYYSMVGNPYAAMMGNPAAMGAMYPNMAPGMGYPYPMANMGGMGTVADQANPFMAQPGAVANAGVTVDGKATDVKPAEGTPVTSSNKYQLG